MKLVEEVRLLRSFFKVCLLCQRQRKTSTCSLKKLVVKVYTMGFKALLMGRMKMTTQLEIVPKGEQKQRCVNFKAARACLPCSYKGIGFHH